MKKLLKYNYDFTAIIITTIITLTLKKTHMVVLSNYIQSIYHIVMVLFICIFVYNSYKKLKWVSKKTKRILFLIIKIILVLICVYYALAMN